ncbi:serine hydrolase domain-containing protein [Pedococcus sp. 2YAF34]|uniref:serine hydrolase domain-containing protein n=1 Tax=Pedococcus sp. 2YAF34 TaxID=3233032 RepID=UPI003F97E598
MGLEPEGFVEQGYGAVGDAFRRNFQDPGEDAAAVAVFHGGRLVADLWGGEDVVNRRPMPRDGLMMVASGSKGMTATVLAMLVQQGRIDPDERVGTYWPEFAVNGKERATVGMVASHTVGVPYPPLGTGLQGLDLHRGEAVTRALAAAEPLWEPGTAMAYHPVTYGTLLDEIVRRATGSTIASHVRRMVAEPLGVEMWMGLPAELDGRVVPGLWEQASPMAPTGEEDAEPGSYAARRLAFLRENPPMDPDFTDPQEVRAHYAAERPGIGAITNARALATMYAAVLGSVDGTRLVDESTLELALTPRTDDVETLIESGTAGPDIRFGLGYQLASPSMPGFGPSSFGHTGAGARLGIADTEHQVAFGYVCSRMRNIGPHGDPRWAALVEAIRGCL